jgi:drug/metabolite transporter (DMT)-like permease
MGGLGHWAIILAYQRAEAPLVAPFAYTELIWATIFGLTFFGDFPDLWTFVGAGIIAASGIYILHRERVRRHARELGQV